MRLDLNISALERTPQFVIAVAWIEIRRSRQNKLTDVGDFSDQAQLSGGLRQQQLSGNIAALCAPPHEQVSLIGVKLDDLLIRQEIRPSEN